MYTKDGFIIVPHSVIAQEFPDVLTSMHDILIDNKIAEAPEVYAICFTVTEDKPKRTLSADAVDVNRVAGAMSPQEWLMHLYEGTLPQYLKEVTLAVYSTSPAYKKLCEWVAANAKRYSVKVAIKGLPYHGFLYMTVIATDKDAARNQAEAMCSGMPVVFKQEDIFAASDISWGVK